MQNCKSKNNLITGIILLILAFVSVVGVLRTVYYSADIDESYAITMAVRIAGGDRMLADMWEPHQMSAVLYAPLVAVYQSIVGSMEGALVFMRFCGVIIQFLISIFLYKTLRRDMSPLLSGLLSCAYFNFTPKHIQSPEFTLIFYWGTMLLMLCLLRFAEKEHTGWVVAAGLCTSVTVLCYPAAVTMFVYVWVWFWIKKYKKQAGCYTAVCAICAICFVAFVMICGGGSGVFENISSVLMDESHDQSLSALFVWHLEELWSIVKVPLAMMVLCHVGRPVIGRRKGKEHHFMSALLFCVSAYAIWQFHTIEKVNFLIFYPIVLQVFMVEWYAYATFAKEEKDRLSFSVTLPLNLAGVVAILFSSNLPASYTMSFFMPSVLLGAWQILRIYKKVQARAVAAVVLLVVVISQLLVARICLVRFTSTQRKNILETYYEVDHGVLKGIRLGEVDYIHYQAKSELLARYVEGEDTFLYVGADMFMYNALKAEQIATGNTISTPAFSQQLMKYYDTHPERIPTVVFVDREYGADFSEVIEKEPMKTFMETYFEMDEAVMEPVVTVYCRER